MKYFGCKVNVEKPPLPLPAWFSVIELGKNSFFHFPKILFKMLTFILFVIERDFLQFRDKMKEAL